MQSLGWSLGIEESPPALWNPSAEHLQTPGQQLLREQAIPSSLSCPWWWHHSLTVQGTDSLVTGPSVVLAVTGTVSACPRTGASPPGAPALQGTQAINADCFLSFQISKVRRGESHLSYLSAPRTGKGYKQNMLWEGGV